MAYRFLSLMLLMTLTASNPLLGYAKSNTVCSQFPDFKANQPLTYFKDSQSVFQSIWPKKKKPVSTAKIWEELCKKKVSSLACGPEEPVSIFRKVIDAYVLIPDGNGGYWSYVINELYQNTYTLLSSAPLVHLHQSSVDYGTRVGFTDPKELDVALNPKTGTLVWEFKCEVSGSVTEGVDYRKSQVKKSGSSFEYTHCLTKSDPINFTLSHLESCSQPLSYKALLKKGRAHIKSEQYLLGIEALEKANAVKPNQSSLLGEISFYSIKAGKSILARKRARDCVKATKKKKIKGACLYNQGRAEEQLGLLNEAKKSYAQSLKFRKNKTVQGRYDALLKASSSGSKCNSYDCLRTYNLDRMCVSLYLKQASWSTDFVTSENCSEREIFEVNQGSWKAYALLVIRFKDIVETFVVHKHDKAWVNPTLISTADRGVLSWTQKEIERHKDFKRP